MSTVLDKKSPRIDALPPDAPDEALVERIAQEKLKQEKEAKKEASVDIEKLMEKHGVKPSISNAELRRSTARNEYIVENVLVRNQPALIGGATKTMKTTTGIDLAISLATGKPFLGVHKVNSVERVLFFTAEIGESTARETEARISKAKEVYKDLDNDCINWQVWVPNIPDIEQLAIVEHEIKRTKPTIVFFDPLYLMLDGNTAMSYSENGKQLRTASQICLNLGATPAFIDHAKRSSENVKQYSPLELEDISGAGKAEFFRQWILISRRRPWEPGQPHELWMSIGGSAGHASILGVSIDESVDEATGERGYKVSTESGRETRDAMAEQRQRNKEERARKQREEKLQSYCDKVLLAMLGGDPRTKNELCTIAGLNTTNAGSAIATLLRSKAIETTEKKVNGRSYEAFIRTAIEQQTAPDSTRQEQLLSDAVG
jgi:hypothetical protein